MTDWLGSIARWIEHHPGSAAWAQAVGATLAVVAAVLVPTLQSRTARRQRDADRRLRAKSLAIAIYPELLHIRAAHRRIQRRLQMLVADGRDGDLADESRQLTIPISDALRAMVPDFYLLGEPIGPDVQACIGRSMKYNDVLGPVLRASVISRLPRMLSFIGDGLIRVQSCIASIETTFAIAPNEDFGADDIISGPGEPALPTRTKETV